MRTWPHAPAVAAEILGEPHAPAVAAAPVAFPQLARLHPVQSTKE